MATIRLKHGMGFFILLILLFVQSCEKTEKEPGYLAGYITIGPLCPVQKVPPDPGCMPTAETYLAYPVSVYSTDGDDRIAKLTPALNGAYYSELLPGKYMLVLDKSVDYIGSCNLPARISITSSDTTYYNVNIDTGIR